MRQTMLIAGMIGAASLTAACVPSEKTLRSVDAELSADAAIAGAIDSPLRNPANVARDRYRHPRETLGFFGVRPDHVVVEFYPGGGWYSEILGPLVKDRGRYIGVVLAGGQGRATITKFIAEHREMFGEQTTVVDFDPALGRMGESGTADRVLTFRNVHNLLTAGDQAAANAFMGFFGALKPGGVLGVVEHRLPEDADPALERTSGYVRVSTVRRLAEAAGFRFAGSSEINANPLDTKDHPNGVWSLPPTLRGKEVGREQFLAIGESDRMTLKFIKPK